PPLHAFRIAADVHTADRRGAARRLQQAAQHADGGVLAGPVSPKKAKHLALGDVERQPVDGHEIAEALREIGNGDGVHWPSARVSSASARCAPATAWVRSSSPWRRATCPSSMAVLVATPAANRSP